MNNDRLHISVILFVLNRAPFWIGVRRRVTRIMITNYAVAWRVVGTIGLGIHVVIAPAVFGVVEVRF